MRYLATVLDGISGEERLVEVDALSESEARLKAGAPHAAVSTLLLDARPRAQSERTRSAAPGSVGGREGARAA